MGTGNCVRHAGVCPVRPRADFLVVCVPQSSELLGPLDPVTYHPCKTQKDWHSLGAHGTNQALKHNLNSGVVGLRHQTHLLCASKCQHSPVLQGADARTPRLSCASSRRTKLSTEMPGCSTQNGEPVITITQAPA